MIRPSEIRKNVSSIKVKFAVFTILIGVISFAIAALFSGKFLADELEKQYEEKALLIWRHVLHDLETGMILRDHRGIENNLTAYRTDNEMLELRLFNRQGEEIFSDQKGPSDPKVEEALKAGAPAKFQKTIEGLFNGKEAASYILPIRNKPECQECHGKSDEVRGAYLISLSRDPLKNKIAQGSWNYSLLFGVLILGIGATTVLAVERLILRPLRSLRDGTEAVIQGDFSRKIPVKSQDEIGSLAGKFNHMAEITNGFLEGIREKNRQLTEQYDLILRSQEEWQEAFDSITDPVAVFDAGGNIFKANRAFREFFSRSDHGAIKKKFYELLLEPESSFQWPRAAATREMSDHQAGKTWQISVFPSYGNNGNFLSAVFITKDITEKKEFEMRSILTERLAAIGQMASGIAHEINNPLATVAVCAEGLLKRVEKGEFAQDFFRNYLRIMGEEVNRCKNITDEMLSFVRKKRNGRENVSVHEVLDRTLEAIGIQGRLARVNVLKKYGEEMPPIPGYEADLRQVFLCVLLNACDAMGDEGTLMIETEIKGNTALTRVRDTGPGIPPGIIGKIFDPFFTTKREKGGTGLGLSIAEKIIREHEGRMDVASEEGKGTTFTITLPL
jgi:PAS domain S-box-containing protein